MYCFNQISADRTRRFPSASLYVASLAALFLVMGGVLSLPAQSRGAGAGGRAGTTGAAPGVAVATTEVRSQSISVAGRLEPRSRIVHSVPSAGFVDSIQVDEGRRVAVGDVLFTLRRRDDLLELYQPIPVTARISGRVTDIAISVAEEVSSGRDAVIVLGDTGYIVQTAVSDKDAFLIEPGRSVVGTTTDGEEISVTLLSRSVEPDYQTGLFTLQFTVPPTAQVRIGSFLVIQIPTQTVEGIFVPADAVVRRFGGDAIWTITAEDTLSATEVTLGEPFGEFIHVVTGLDEGLQYLTAPTGREREGNPAPTAGVPPQSD